MAREPDNLVLTLLREIRDTLQEHSRMHNQHSEEFRRLRARLKTPTAVMPGLEPGIPGPRARNLRPWIAGSGPAMTGVDETPES
jgi:hypothetical protein